MSTPKTNCLSVVSLKEVGIEKCQNCWLNCPLMSTPKTNCLSVVSLKEVGIEKCQNCWLNCPLMSTPHIMPLKSFMYLNEYFPCQFKCKLLTVVTEDFININWVIQDDSRNQNENRGRSY